MLERSFSIFLFLFVGILLVMSFALPLHANNGMLGSGFFPQLISTILIIFVACYAGKSFWSKRLVKKGENQENTPNNRENIRRQITFIASILASLVMVPVAGMLLSVMLFAFVVLVFVEKMPWGRSFKFTIPFIFLIYLIFEIGFGLELPKGILGI